MWSTFLLCYLGFPKIAFFYYMANELYWEDEEEEDELEQLDDEADYIFDPTSLDIPLFFTPKYVYYFRDVIKSITLDFGLHLQKDKLGFSWYLN